MKVEFDLSALQLKMLDESMTKLLENLSEGQKMTIVSNYINHKFDVIEAESNSYNSCSAYYRNDEKKLSAFGKELVCALQEKITETVSKMVMEHENYKKIIDENTEKIINRLPEILEKAISNHAAETLCNSKYEIESRIQMELCQMRQEIANR